jgi:hypothetical protein
LLHDRAQRRTLVDVPIVTPAVALAFEKECGLINPVDDSIARNEFGRLSDPGKCRIEISYVDNIARKAACPINIAT